MPRKSLLCDSWSGGQQKTPEKTLGFFGKLVEAGRGAHGNPRRASSSRAEPRAELRAASERLPIPGPSAAAVSFAEPAEAGRPLEVAVPSPPTALPGAPGSSWDPKTSSPVTLTRKSGLPEAKSVLGKNWFKSRYRRKELRGVGT